MRSLFRRKPKDTRQQQQLLASPDSPPGLGEQQQQLIVPFPPPGASLIDPQQREPPQPPPSQQPPTSRDQWAYPTPPPSTSQPPLLPPPPLVRPTPLPAARRDLTSVLPASSAGFGAPAGVSGMARGEGGVAGSEGAGTGLSVSIDFGTTFSGVSFASDKVHNGEVQQVLNWPGTHETFRKIPTCLVYSASGEVRAWGLEAKGWNVFPDGATGGPDGGYKCEWFKLYLEPSVLRRHGGAYGSLSGSSGLGKDAEDGDERLPPLPPGKSPQDVISDYLAHLWAHARAEITRELGVVEGLDGCVVWVTVPAAWDAKGCDIIRSAAIQAGLVRSTGAGDWAWRNRLKIITEPEAAAVHCATLTELHGLRAPQTFIVFDGGGGTCDLATYRLLGTLSTLEIAELSARSGASCGSLFLDLRFRALVAHLLRAHPAHLDGPSTANFVHVFAETEKLLFRGGEEDDRTWWRFACFNQEDPDDPSCNLINGELAILGVVLRQEVFDPVIDQVLELIADQIARAQGKVDALLLVGGFSASEYLMRRVEERFGREVGVIARPTDCDVATVQGAARYGLANRPLVSAVVCPKAYVMKVKLPAEAQDFNLRPAYVTPAGGGGAFVCQNRVQYLAHKGAVVRKGQRLKTSFCKYSRDAEDRLFMTTLYTSDAAGVMRYTDEGALEPLCRWTVDLSPLPGFRRAVAAGAQAFYTEFELALELDSAEVRGVLVYDDEDWGRAVFEMF